MAYFEDLSAGRYGPQGFDPANWSVPLRYVGWLEHPHPFTTGEVADEVVDALLGLHQRFRDHFAGFRGYHRCSICEVEGREPESLVGSHTNLFIPGDNEVFVAPGRIDHYICEHGYRPPQSFIDAVMKCPPPATDAFFTQLAKANAGGSTALGHVVPAFPASTIAPVDDPEGALAYETARLRELGYEGAIGSDRFAALEARMWNACQAETSVRSYKAKIYCGDEPVWVRVDARTPFEARFAMHHAFPDAPVRFFNDENRPPLSRHDSIPGKITAPGLPFAQATLDLIVAHALDETYGPTTPRSEPHCAYLRAKLAAEYFEFDELRPFSGTFQIGGDEFELVVNARSQIEARLAAVAEFGDGHRYWPYQERPSWWKSKERLSEDEPSSDPHDFLEVPGLPVSESTFSRLCEVRRRRRKIEPSAQDEQGLSERYFGGQSSEWRGYVFADGTRTFVRVSARTSDEAKLVAQDRFGEFAPVFLRRVDPAATPAP